MWVANIPEQLRAKKLFKDQFVAMVAKGHPHNKPTFDTKSYARHNHLLTSPLGTKGVEVLFVSNFRRAGLVSSHCSPFLISL